MEPSGAGCSSRKPPPFCTAASGLAIQAGGRVVLLERLGFADDRPVSLSQHCFPPPGCVGVLDALRAAPTITQAVKGGRRFRRSA